MTKISVVIASYNRKATTLACLDSLEHQVAAQAKLDVFLLDDASPDGTAEAVQEKFPGVHVLIGNGDLFWGGGMHAAMSAACNAPYDFILWLNDDVQLKADAIERLLGTYHEMCLETQSPLNVIVGAFADPRSGLVSYSAFNRVSKFHPAKLVRVEPNSNAPQRCDTLNGNCVLIPKLMVDKVGLIDTAFVQQLGDIDYGYRIVKSGGSIWLPNFFSGTCKSNESPKRWLNYSRGSKARWKILMSPHGLPFFSWRIFYSKYAGLLAWPLLLQMYAKQQFMVAPLRKQTGA